MKENRLREELTKQDMIVAIEVDSKQTIEEFLKEHAIVYRDSEGNILEYILPRSSFKPTKDGKLDTVTEL